MVTSNLSSHSSAFKLFLPMTGICVRAAVCDNWIAVRAFHCKIMILRMTYYVILKIRGYILVIGMSGVVQLTANLHQLASSFFFLHV